MKDDRDAVLEPGQRWMFPRTRRTIEIVDFPRPGAVRFKGTNADGQPTLETYSCEFVRKNMERVL